MPVFDRYILNQIFPPLGFTLLVALLILLVERSLRVLDMVLGNSGALHYVARMMPESTQRQRLISTKCIAGLTALFKLVNNIPPLGRTAANSGSQNQAF